MQWHFSSTPTVLTYTTFNWIWCLLQCFFHKWFPHLWFNFLFPFSVYCCHLGLDSLQVFEVKIQQRLNQDRNVCLPLKRSLAVVRPGLREWLGEVLSAPGCGHSTPAKEKGTKGHAAPPPPKGAPPRSSTEHFVPAFDQHLVSMATAGWKGSWKVWFLIWMVVCLAEIRDPITKEEGTFLCRGKIMRTLA